LVENKTDETKKLEVDFNEAREFATEHNSQFSLTSAKNGERIDDLFSSDGSLILQRKIDEAITYSLSPSENPRHHSC
jgi:hypothetical protein